MKKLIYVLFSLIVISLFCGASVSAKTLLYAATVDDMLELYLSPDKDSLKITDIPGCAELTLISTEGTWGNVVFANKCGWINTSFTRDSYEEAAATTGFEAIKNVETNSDENKVKLYTLPSDKVMYGSEEKYSVPDGVILKIARETHDGWGLVSLDDDYLWVNLKYTKPYITEAEQAAEDYGLQYVYTFSESGNGVRLYSDSNGSKALTTIADCVKLTVRKSENNYAYVSYNGINGWVNLDDTTKSFSNAQANTGKEVNAEYKILGESSSGVDIFNVPSNKIKDDAIVIGSVGSGTKIYVQRCTEDGWMLVNHNGKVGWIPPDSAQLQPNDDLLLIEPLAEKKDGYVLTGNESGLSLYPQYNNNTVVAKIPECVRVEILAEKDGRQYVYCDYASGWTAPGGLVDSYENALDAKRLKKTVRYRVKENTAVMSLPLSQYLCGNKKLLTMGKGTDIKVIRIVTTEKTKWGLVNIDGKKGWVNLGKTSRIYSPLEIVLFVLGILLGIFVIVFAVSFAVRKIKALRKKKKTKSDDESAPEYEDGKAEEVAQSEEK